MKLDTLKTEVRALYDRNRQKGHAPWCDKDYDFVCPSSGTYPFQWLWDSCFHAVVLSHIDVARGESEITSLLANAHADGLVSHVTFWQRERYEALLSTYAIAYRTPNLSNCMQPPVIAEAVHAVAKRGRGAAFIREVLPATRRFYDWLDRVRDPDRDGLIATLQTDESGLDHTPKYDAYIGLDPVTHADHTAAWNRVASVYDSDAVKRDPVKMFAADKFICEDVLVNTIYAENLRLLADLHRQVGQEDDAKEIDARASKTRNALFTKCWDEESGLFFDLAGQREEKLRVSTVSSLFPLALPETPPAIAKRLIEHLADPKDYASPYPVPTVSMKEPLFSPDWIENIMVFRGTTWMNTSWYIARGLRLHGEEKMARHIEDQSVELIAKSGFREHYQPRTGEGFGAKDFSWSALALDMIASRHET
jgi:hypothetical protein